MISWIRQLVLALAIAQIATGPSLSLSESGGLSPPKALPNLNKNQPSLLEETVRRPPSGCRDARQDGIAADGTTDDTAALVRAAQNALSGPVQGAGCVVLPAGKIRLCRVELPPFESGLQVLGAGIGSTQIIPCNPDTSIFVVRPGKIENRNLRFRGFTVAPEVQSRRGAIFDIANTYNVVIEEIAATRGFDFARLKDITIASICGTDLRSFDGVVFTLDGGFDFRFCPNNNYDDDTAEAEAVAYLYVKKGGGIHIAGVDAIHCGDCFLFRPDRAGDTIEWVFVSDAQADTCSGNGWTLHAPAGTTIKGFHAVGLWSASCAVHGFATSGEGTIDGVFLTGPRLQYNAGWGGNFATGNNVFLSNPQVSGNGRDGGESGGVNFGSALGSLGVSGGKIGALFGYPNTHWANIALRVGAGKEVVISGVNLCGFREGGSALVVEGSTAGAQRIIRDNLCFNPSD